MTEVEKRPPGLFTRAEAGSRQIVLQVGLGFLCFVVGSIISGGATSRIADRIGPLESEAVAWVMGQILQRLWIFVLLPFFGFAIGRFTEINPLRFALVAGFSGETFALLLAAAINGTDALVDDPKAVVARIVTLFIGLAITMSAVISGRTAAADVQAEANVLAEKRKAEYAEFLAKAEGKSEPSSAPPTSEPSQSTERREP
jgi:hypothetical protein